jgi:hypothetical protein
MKRFFAALLAAGLLLVSGCDTVSDRSPARISNMQQTQAASLVDSVGLEKEPTPVSLFPADQAILPDAAVAKILSSVVQVYEQPRLAIIKFPDQGSQFYGPYYWRNEDYVKLQESQITALTSPLPREQMGRVFPLPSLMTPRQMSIPLLREAAVRVQADLLLVYRTHSDTYTRSRAFAKDKVKAYCTCEVVLLDIATGIAPFTSVMTRDRLETQTSGDLDFSETMRRAEQEATGDALLAAAEDLAKFVKTIKHRPRPEPGS